MCSQGELETDAILGKDWPSKGEITYQNYATRYRDGLDLVVKDFTLEIKSGEKVFQSFSYSTKVSGVCAHRFIV